VVLWGCGNGLDGGLVDELLPAAALYDVEAVFAAGMASAILLDQVDVRDKLGLVEASDVRVGGGALALLLLLLLLAVVVMLVAGGELS